MISNKRKMICAIIAWLCVIAWCGFIYSMSADNGTESSEKSGELVDFAAGILVPNYGEMAPAEKNEVKSALSFPIRKLAHIAEYTVLGALTAIAVLLTPRLENQWLRAILPFLLSVIYAASDEYHQSFVPGRGPSVADVCIDAVGIALGVAAVIILSGITLKIRKKDTEH